ncbi:MAG: hypothetical protein IJ399_04585 [Bacilli bacterium]|nr:hypothetical protein [Bacilli bacterium]
MKIKTYRGRELKKLLSQKTVNDSCNVFKTNSGIEKIYKDVLFDLQRFSHVMMPISVVDEEQIKWLHEKQDVILTSTLPNGIIYFEHYPIGVMYPKCFEGYKSFNEIHNEETSVFFENFKTALVNNIELMNNGIYNYDFTMGNILYKEDDVRLIDLDGKYISKRKDYQKVYTYFMVGMISQIVKKIESQYSGIEQKLALSELRNILSRVPSSPMEIDYPIILLDEIEDSQILKR